MPERGASEVFISAEELHDPFPHERVRALRGHSMSGRIESCTKQGLGAVQMAGGKLCASGIDQLGGARLPHEPEWRGANRENGGDAEEPGGNGRVRATRSEERRVGEE